MSNQKHCSLCRLHNLQWKNGHCVDVCLSELAIRMQEWLPMIFLHVFIPFQSRKINHSKWMKTDTNWQSKWQMRGKLNYHAYNASDEGIPYLHAITGGYSVLHRIALNAYWIETIWENRRRENCSQVRKFYIFNSDILIIGQRIRISNKRGGLACGQLTLPISCFRTMHLHSNKASG